MRKGQEQVIGLNPGHDASVLKKPDKDLSLLH
jgi:hypothetical protein